ncbi:MAG: hypothetical protein ACLGIN_11645, partial [Candidatus Sericytochromatia bacterium]
SPAPTTGGLNDLVKQAAQTEAELKENLDTPLTLPFPIRLGVLFFNYSPTIQPEDQQTALATMRQDLIATGQVKTMVKIPSTLVGPNDSLETIRRLVSRFGVDTVLIVSGTHDFQRSDSQSTGFFDGFSNKANYEARTTLTALGMNVLTGRFMAPLTAVGKVGPETLNPDEGNFSGKRYELQKGAELMAMTELKTQFAAALKLIDSAPAPEASPAASPTPEPTPEPEATQEAEATAEAEATSAAS